MKHRLAHLCALTIGLLATTAAIASAAPSLELDKTDYLPNEEIHVRFTANPAWPENAWVGIVPSNVPHGSEAKNDETKTTYQYIEKKASGSLTFNAPSQTGSWDVRMNDDDDNGKEVASVTFHVSRPTAKAAIKLNKSQVMPGDEVEVQIAITGKLPDDAWVGINPSTSPHGSEKANDETKTTYEYLHGKTSGTIKLNAPDKPGAYDVRLNDSDEDGQEIASVPLQVGAPNAKATLTLPRSRFIPGETMKVQFNVEGQLPDNAWVGIVPSKVPHGSEETNDQNDLNYEHLHKRTSGTIDFLAPVDAGSYDLRLNDSDDNGREVASVTFQVSGDVTADEMAKQIAATGKIALYGIRFDTGKAEIKPEAAGVLEQVGKLLASQLGLRLRVEGHTDDVGDDAANLALSQKRAEAVKGYLVSRLHVDAGRLEAKGFGETRPVGDNKRAEGRAENRRVELVRE